MMGKENWNGWTSIDLLASVDADDLSYAIEANEEVSEWVGTDDDKAARVIAEASRIIARERRDGGDTAINDAAWEMISKIAKLAVAQAIKKLEK